MKRAFLAGGFLTIALAVGVFLLLRFPTSTPQLPVKELDPWILQTNDPENSYSVYIGNGYIAMRIGPEGVGASDERPSLCLMSGLYEDEALKPLPNWSDFPLYDEDGEQFHLDKRASYRQTLDMHEGYVKTELTLRSGRQTLSGQVTFFIVRPETRGFGGTDAHIAAIRYELTPGRDGVILLKNHPPSGEGWHNVEARVSESGAAIVRGYTATGEEMAVGTVVMEFDSNGKELLEVRRAEPFVLTKYSAVSSTTGGTSAQNVDAALAQVTVAGYDKLFAPHKQAWRDMWKSDIIIEGDPAAQQAVRAMMFYLLCSASPDWSIPPTGISSQAWGGHIFWDADIWMFPALLLQHPELAAGMVRYRLNVLDGYRENARERGLQGAEVAWESARTGRETIGLPQSEQRHVTADAAIAAWIMSLANSTPDPDDPLSMTFEFLRATAEYWASRVTYNQNEDRYEIMQVMPPDEDAMIVDNSVYTNIAAKINLDLAIAASKRKGRDYPRKWEEITRKMYIPFDEGNRRFVEYDGYDGHQTKQADVELLIYPLMHPMTEEVKRNTFNFYKTRINPRGPAMSSAIHAIIAAELGRPEEAYDHFLASYLDFLRGPFLMFNEKRSITYENMCFVTACGGTIQSVIYGFGGVRLHWRPDSGDRLGSLSFNPVLPPNWKSLKITNLQWDGKSFDLIVEQGKPYRIVERPD